MIRRLPFMRSAFLAFTMISLCVVPLTASAATRESGQGVWRRHKVQFTVFTTGGARLYLSGELDGILLKAGAKMNTPVNIAPSGGARLGFSTLHRAQRGEGTRAVGQVAVWRGVEFRYSLSDPNNPSCELVYQFKIQLLRYFETRKVRYGLPCAASPPGYFGGYYVKFQVLVPATAAVKKAGRNASD